MSVFAIKITAVVSMFIDHVCYVMALAGILSFTSPLYRAGRAVGRVAFVFFAFLLVNGFDKTRDRKRYFSRLLLFAVLSQLPFTLAFTSSNYHGGAPSLLSFDAANTLPLLLPLCVYFCFGCQRRFEPSVFLLAAAFALAGTALSIGGITLLAARMNVFFTLAVSLSIMTAVEYALSPDRSGTRVLVIAAALAAELYFLQRHADYGLSGAALIVGLYCLRSRRPFQLVFLALWCVLEYYGQPYYLIGALFALVPIALYNGRLGPKLRAAFYMFYPAHLALLALVFILLSRR